VNSPTQVKNLVPFTHFAIDLAENTLPNYAFIVPNLCNDGHDCPAATVDQWLQANIAPLVGSSQFQRDGLLIVTYDEAADSDVRQGGGRIAWVAVSGKSKRGYRSSTLYQHQSTLRLTAQALGLTIFPNLAATAPDMREFFLF
jgi:acid phosphatase